MTEDYLILSWTEAGDAARVAEWARRAELTLGYEVVWSHPRARILAAQDVRLTTLSGDQGIILGDLFRRDTSERITGPLPDQVAHQVIQTAGGYLLDHFWGSYVACVADGTISVLRDPSGALDCYTLAVDGLRLFFPNVGIPIALDLLDPQVDWANLAAWVANHGRTTGTCLSGVEEVRPGARLSHRARDVSIAEMWSPWTFAAQDAQFEDREQAVQMLRDRMSQATDAFAATAMRPMIELSGGLDSSAVASCLHQAGAGFVCATLATQDPGADERRYAQAVADRFGAPLTVIDLSADYPDLFDAPVGRGPRPSDHPLRIMTNALITGAGRQSSADAFFRGSGGDYVFGYLGTSAPAADAVLAKGLGATAWRATGDVAALHRSSIWAAGKFALKKAFAPPRWPSPSQAPFIVPAPLWAEEDAHPWSVMPKDALPGKVAQVSMLLNGQSFREGRDRGGLGPVRMPILSQPVVETALRTPSWMCVTGGRNRAVARDAFKDWLPPLILERRTKGTFQALNQKLFRRHRQRIAALLLEGELAAGGILVKSELQAALAGKEGRSALEPTLLLELACTELWLRNWKGVSLHPTIAAVRALPPNADIARA